MQIRIKSTPPGEAPDHIRQAWIGLVLPIVPGVEGRRKGIGFGVLSGPKTAWGTRIALFFGRGELQEGYYVESQAAVNLLAAHSLEAAMWWRQNAPRFVSPGQYFLFAANCCEELPDSAKE